MDKMGTFIAGAFYGSLVTFFTMCVAYCFKSSRNENILRQQLEEVTEKHYNECGQIAHYSDENAKLKKLLRKAMEDIKDCIYYHIHCENCALYASNGDCPVADNDECGEKCKWRYADEALALIGGGENGT